MDDVADDIETTDTVAPGEPVRPGRLPYGHINDGPDQDFYAVTLIGGQRYTFDVVPNRNPGENYLFDATLAVRDNGGNPLAFDDDSGVDLNPHIDFVATYTGTYFLDVGSSRRRQGRLHPGRLTDARAHGGIPPRPRMAGAGFPPARALRGKRPGGGGLPRGRARREAAPHAGERRSSPIRPDQARSRIAPERRGERSAATGQDLCASMPGLDPMLFTLAG